MEAFYILYNSFRDRFKGTSLTYLFIDDRRYTKDEIHQSKENHREDDVAHIDPEDTRNTVTEEIRPKSNIDNCII